MLQPVVFLDVLRATDLLNMQKEKSELKNSSLLIEKVYAQTGLVYTLFSRTAPSGISNFTPGLAAILTFPFKNFQIIDMK